MKRLLCPSLPRPGSPAQLSDAEARHALQVWRLRTGDPVIAMDAQGGIVEASLRVAGERVFLDFMKNPEPASAITLTAHSDPLPVILELAILKGEAMEWVVEKAVELNISELVPLITDHTVVQLDRKGPGAFQERWQRIADQSLKQCGRLKRLNVAMPIRLQDHLTRTSSEGHATRLFCDEAERTETPHLMNWLQREWNPGTPVRLLIGPEGGWSQAERQAILARPESGMPVKTVSLGPWVLRAETAALFGMSLTAGLIQSYSGTHT
ncbi:MAG: hypothetical protein A2X94_14840 [Bdellovibrionales bacterium GWB1_55_8]|nr:MAG: hypothetical protein A2X94_14840 [Bdellovibrionales bacterium GWB1_55_8]